MGHEKFKNEDEDDNEIDEIDEIDEIYDTSINVFNDIVVQIQKTLSRPTTIMFIVFILLILIIVYLYLSGNLC